MYLYEAIYSRGIIFLSGEIKAELANMLVGLMIYFGLKNPTDDNDMFMFISSPGGSIRHGTAIFDTMQTVTPRVHTVGLGLVASMAALILSGGEPTSRVALPHTRIMIHQPICTYMELFYNENLMQWNEMQKLRRQVVKMYMAKTGQVRRIVIKDLERDYFMSAIEAKNYGTFGIVDSVGSWQ
uniref:ATP-dependent Clp protease proteolytic subunit n=1 Tax=Saurauia tristyla TaxID=374845 RepID=A0A516ICC9_9ERIC|nr:clp protease proteolytic subunit [Saurauia tristyla]QDP13781.1 clp protease proteolytic subunit [Saurauia tristyla]